MTATVFSTLLPGGSNAAWGGHFPGLRTDAPSEPPGNNWGLPSNEYLEPDSGNVGFSRTIGMGEEKSPKDRFIGKLEVYPVDKSAMGIFQGPRATFTGKTTLVLLRKSFNRKGF
jgi:hypothetical protein